MNVPSNIVTTLRVDRIRLLQANFNLKEKQWIIRILESVPNPIAAVSVNKTVQKESARTVIGLNDVPGLTDFMEEHNLSGWTSQLAEQLASRAELAFLRNPGHKEK